MVTSRVIRRAPAVRLALVAALVAGGAVIVTESSTATTEPALTATPRARCGPGSRPETDIQGRVPAVDYASGRAARGYRCNAVLVGHHGKAGGYKTFRYVDRAGHRCAFYDSTLLLPKDLLENLSTSGLGVKVLDMSNPGRPRLTANLVSAAMLNPHESLGLNKKRGLLAASLGSPATAPGVVDLYDVRTDCRHPRILSTSLEGLLGHESGFAPDGRTLYLTGTSGPTFVALDVSNPRRPRTLFQQFGVRYHGLRVSGDGRTLYVADTAASVSGNAGLAGGLRILDVSQIQDRRPNPQVRVISDLTWRGGSIPQHADPITIRRHKYLLEMDEFASFGSGLLTGLGYDAEASVGAARLINIDDPRAPYVASNLRLAVNQPAARRGPQRNDPGAYLPVQGYAGHYCSAPRRRNPKLVACSFIASGLRVFNIENPRRPREVAYFNQPAVGDTNPFRQGAWAMSAPAWDLKRKQVWYTDANGGFFAVRLTNGVL